MVAARSDEWKYAAEAVVGVGRVATIRMPCTHSLTCPTWKSVQKEAMPRPSSASPCERASEATVTSCAVDRCRIMLNGRIFPPRFGGYGKRWQT